MTASGNEDNERDPRVAPRLLELVSELTDGQPSAAELVELRALLAADQAALEWYCEWMSVHAMLHLDLAVGQASLPTAPLASLDGTPLVLQFPERVSRRVARRWAAVTALAGAAAASFLFLAIRRAPEPAAQLPAQELVAVAPRPEQRPEILLSDEARREFERVDSRALAILSRVAEAAWSGTTPLAPGSAVPAGRFVLDSGAVQLEFLSGANLVVEGPADIELISTTLVYCHRGKLRARVPTQAHGFTIETPTHRAVDLGTEFAVNVDLDSSTEVHVLDGEVRLQDKAREGADDELLLALGDGFRAPAGGRGMPIKADASQFLDAERLLELADRNGESRYATWRQFGARLAANPDVVAYFSFENHAPWQRVLRQDGPGVDESLAGAVVGCRWSEGRWRQKQALEFKGPEDRVKLSIPGEFDSVSLACWVRVEGFDRWLSSLLLTEGHDVGEVHWQFTETGQLLLGVKADAEWSQDYYSPVVLRPADLGRWVHMVCVYDAEGGNVLHYVDGARRGSEPIRKPVKLRFGAAELGNWAPEAFRDHTNRNLNGRIDEFAVFDVPLTDDDVREMYEAGKPN